MARVSTYLNFPGNTRQAFEFYRGAFGTEFIGPVRTMGEVPAAPGMPTLTDEQRQAVLHVELPITGGHVLMGTDALESMGHPLTMGRNISLNLEPDTRAEADRLFTALSVGGTINAPMADMFWGAYWGSFIDQFGVQWMINCMAK